MLARVVAVAGTAAVAISFAATPASADTAAATAVTPSVVHAGSGIAITGTGLGGVTGVVFTGAAVVTPTKVTDVEVDAVVPSAARSGALTLRTPSGDVTAPPVTVLPTASIAASRHSVIYPATSSLTGSLTSAGVGIPGVSGKLQSRTAGYSTWVSGPTSTTDSGGHVHFTVKPLATMAYRVVFGATASYGAATSAAVTVVQHPAVTVSAPSAAPILTTLHITGTVKPTQTGAVQLQRLYSGAWHLLSSGHLTSTGHYSFGVKLPSKGTFSYRVRRPSDTHQAGNTTATVRILGVARTLRSGMSGPDVTALQNRLHALHYDVGRISGSYGFDTVHAVVAFEKVQRLTRDGVTGTRVWAALATPRVPRLAHPYRGVSAIEVDLTHQVLYYAVDGRIARILDSSTGGGYSYVGSDGTTQRAITPTGHFSVKYKVNHWVTAKLGVLYRPAYFNYSGYAIHGEPLVPSYPASHGCVRITVPAMDRLYDKLAAGMSVWIYAG